MHLNASARRLTVGSACVAFIQHVAQFYRAAAAPPDWETALTMATQLILNTHTHTHRERKRERDTVGHARIYKLVCIT